jgi:2,4-dienoyl-CoA reductase-like NADH-dependent reductase (Old Yellow Enzyme family)
MTDSRSDAASHPIFRPGKLGDLTLRNRVIKTATYEGMVHERLPTAQLLRHHRDLARGGVGMTTLAYCSVSPDGRTFADQLVMSREAVPHLRAIVDAVHAEGSAISIQLGHCGAFSKNSELGRARPAGASPGLNAYGLMSGLPRADAMTEADMDKTAEEFASAAKLAMEAGFDAVELHLGHGYLLSQFISPFRNRRRDRFGGDLEGRMRFPLDVVRRVRAAVGPGYPVLAKTNLDDGVKGGLHAEEAAEAAVMLEDAAVTGLVLSGGLVSHSPLFLLRGGRPLRDMIEVEKSPMQKVALMLFGPIFVRKVPYEPLFFLRDARIVRARVKLPLVLLGGITSMADLGRAMDEGFDFVAMGRALIHDPSLLTAYARGERSTSGCTPCNRCITEMDRPGGVCCALSPEQQRQREAEVRAGLHRRLAAVDDLGRS